MFWQVPARLTVVAAAMVGDQVMKAAASAKAAAAADNRANVCRVMTAG
jgi:hypothetical protein